MSRRTATHGLEPSRSASPGQGHAVTGDRGLKRRRDAGARGYEQAHAIVDDQSSLAYAELLRTTSAGATVERLRRPARSRSEPRTGSGPKRLMTGNDWSYTRNRSPARAARRRVGYNHRRTLKRLATTRTASSRACTRRRPANGPTASRYRSSRHRAAALPHWLALVQRSQTAQLARRLPRISRVHNVCRLQRAGRVDPGSCDGRPYGGSTGTRPKRGKISGVTKAVISLIRVPSRVSTSSAAAT